MTGNSDSQPFINISFNQSLKILQIVRKKRWTITHDAMYRCKSKLCHECRATNTDSITNLNKLSITLSLDLFQADQFHNGQERFQFNEGIAPI